MITYNDIYEALRKERYSEQLQELPKNFVEEVAEYLKEKEKIVKKEENIFSDIAVKTKKQLENAISLFRELMRKRREKILNLAFVAVETGISKRDYDNMFEFEKEMFNNIVKNIEETNKKIEELMNGKKEISTMMICFRENVEEFLDADGNKLGPFEKGEIANLPEEIAKILIEAGRAEPVE